MVEAVLVACWVAFCVGFFVILGRTTVETPQSDEDRWLDEQF